MCTKCILLSIFKCSCTSFDYKEKNLENTSGFTNCRILKSMKRSNVTEKTTCVSINFYSISFFVSKICRLICVNMLKRKSNDLLLYGLNENNFVITKTRLSFVPLDWLATLWIKSTPLAWYHSLVAFYKLNLARRLLTHRADEKMLKVVFKHSSMYISLNNLGR